MRIGMVGSCCWPVLGGMEIYLHQLARALQARGHDMRVAARFVRARPAGMRGLHRSWEPPGAVECDGLAVTVIAPGLLGRAWLAPAHRLHWYPATERLAAWMFAQPFLRPLRAALAGCDVLHWNGTGRELLGHAVARVARELGVPLVVTPHVHAGAWGDSSLDLALYGQAGRVLAHTRFERDHLAGKGLDPERLAVIGNGVAIAGGGNGERFRRRWGLAGPVVLFLGRRLPYKGAGLLATAAPRVWQRFPEARVVLAGPVEEPDLPPGPRDPRLVEVGPLAGQDREDAYAGCDVFCLPSRGECFGIAYLEAWRYGKPVVALDLPPLRELIPRGGLLVEPAPEAVAGALVRLLADPQESARLGEAGRQAAQDYTWVAVASQVEAVYDRLRGAVV